MTVIIDLINDSTTPGVPTDTDMQRWSDAALKHLPHSNKTLSIGVRVVDEAESAETNFAYRQKNYATNVLSFAADVPEAVVDSLDEVPLGDLLICAPVVAREANEQGKKLDAHWAHMLIHGLLHLHGFDHENDTESAEMEALESTILLSLGFDNPYQAELLQH
ncbi:MAG: rRNA maturation RNase YbeY [Gammaproteobacteria bacterium]|nr:rRNA maturation RNase YbeY [Gammaproteobacteria bacterium]